MLNQIPNLTRGQDSALPKSVLESKLKTIDRRRATIEATLAHIPDSYHRQELEAEFASLSSARREIEDVLHPKPKPALTPELEKAYAEQRVRDINFLRVAIKQEIEQLEHNAANAEMSGNHRQARLLRMQLPDVGETLCKQFGKDLSLLAEIDD